MSSSSSDEEPVPSVTNSFKEYEARLQSTIMSCAVQASRLPAKSDISFQRTLNRKLAKDLDACSTRILDFANQLLQFTRGDSLEPSAADRKQSGGTKAKPNSSGRLKDEEDVIENYHALIIDVVDGLLENADRCIDEFAGKKPTLAVPLKVVQEAPKPALPRLDKSLLHAAHLSKPQEKFQPPVDNYIAPWKPNLDHKPHASKPLSESYSHDWIDAPSDQIPLELSPHPYRYEISHITYPPRMMANITPRAPRTFEETPFTWVDKPSQVSKLLSKLKDAEEIAIDLEYHSYRSYHGFVCLMQISTREEDWVVDTLALRNELQSLNEVFANPSIVKVLHGAERDVTWLQQDFNLYLVNLFDTYHASVALDFPKHSLAHLLSIYCDFTADKRYQMADWRIRPLPEEMLHYARSDTHFLLFVFDSLRNALLERGSEELVRQVLASSERTALNVCSWEGYHPDGHGPGGWVNLARKWNKGLFGVQQAVFTAIHSWRDRIAREEDESVAYVLPNHFLFKLVERPPATPAALLSIVQPPTPVVRARITELVKTIQDAQVKFEERKSRLAEDPHTTQPDVSTPEPRRAIQSTTEVTTATSNLWEFNNTALLAAPSSSLFGPSRKPTSSPSARFSASSSSLFSARPIPPDSTLALESFKSTVDKIHAALALTTRTYNLPTVTSLAVIPSVEPSAPPIPLEPEQLPFVPAPERAAATSAVDEIDEGIVVVGAAARQKKRKRDKQKKAKEPESAPDTAKTDQEAANDVPDFDYSTAPNILDQPAATDDAVPSTVKKRKVGEGKMKGKTNPNPANGDFAPTPRPTHEPRSGNKSRTFK